MKESYEAITRKICEHEDFSHYLDSCALDSKGQDDEMLNSSESAQIQDWFDRMDEEIHILKKKINWILQEFTVPDIKKKGKRKSKKQRVGR